LGAIVVAGQCGFIDGESGLVKNLTELSVEDGRWCTKSAEGIIVPYEQVMDFEQDGENEI
jgi:hypothetical protein